MKAKVMFNSPFYVPTAQNLPHGYVGEGSNFLDRTYIDDDAGYLVIETACGQMAVPPGFVHPVDLGWVVRNPNPDDFWITGVEYEGARNALCAMWGVSFPKPYVTDITSRMGWFEDLAVYDTYRKAIGLDLKITTPVSRQRRAVKKTQHAIKAGKIRLNETGVKLFSAVEKVDAFVIYAPLAVYGEFRVPRHVKTENQ